MKSLHIKLTENDTEVLFLVKSDQFRVDSFLAAFAAFWTASANFWAYTVYYNLYSPVRLNERKNTFNNEPTILY